VAVYENSEDTAILGWRAPTDPAEVITTFTRKALVEHERTDKKGKEAIGESFWRTLYHFLYESGAGEPMEQMTIKNAWEMYEAMMEARTSRILTYGPPGLGKSYSPAKWAKEHDAFYIGITLTDQTPMSELRGHFILKGNEFVWHDGCVARAWRKSHEGPSILVLNEINEAGTDVETFLHNVLDDPEFARLDLPNNETVRPDPNNMITVATMNGLPHHLREALRDRFPVKIEVSTVHPDAIAALPKDLRPLAERWTAPTTGKERMSIRPFVAFAQLRERVDPIIAAQAIFGPQAHDIVAALGIGETA
jgi:hypothetical protein